MGKITWNYECFRDFCGSFYKWMEEEDEHLRHNKGLIFFLTEAINNLSSDNNNYKELLLSDDDDYYDDYRSDINIKNVIIDTMCNGHKITSEEIAAFLDLVYIDLLPVDVEMEADRLIKNQENKKKSVVSAAPGSLAEFALTHGCDYMDMNTMKIYHPV